MVFVRGLGSTFLLYSAFLMATTASANPRHPSIVRPLPPKVALEPDMPVTSRNGTSLPPYNTVYYFDQLIDHNNPNAGTFKQRYWHTYEFYEPGGPIILTTPGETNANGFEGYLTNTTINGLIAQRQNGATVVLEHRFFGYSNPRPDLSVASLQLLTVEQSIADLVYFAQNVHLPMPNGNQVAPGKAPWVLIGGSYSGALTAFTKVSQPDIFWAAYASSAVVESIIDFWGYWDVVRQFMPQNCSADVQAVIQYVDGALQSGDSAQIEYIENAFGMQIQNPAYFGAALAQDLATWQDMSPSDGTEDAFFRFCDALEVQDGEIAPASGWGLDYALPSWGNYWMRTTATAVCGNENAEDCPGTSNRSLADTSVNNAGRSWMWFTCNWFGWWQNGAPEGTPTIVSRFVDSNYYEQLCVDYFPEQFSTPTNPNINLPNDAYGGWYMEADRLFFATGQRDPWRDATMSADGISIQSTSSQPIAESDGFHCSDLITVNGVVDSTIGRVQSLALSYMETWLAEWRPSN